MRNLLVVSPLHTVCAFVMHMTMFICCSTQLHAKLHSKAALVWAQSSLQVTLDNGLS
jgi:hypothetical protein